MVALLPWQAAVAATIMLAAVPVLWYAFSIRWVLLFLGAVVLLPPLPLPFGNAGPNAAVIIAGVGLLAGCAHAAEWEFQWRSLPCALLAYTAALILSLGFALANAGLAVAAGSAARIALFGISVYVFFSAAQGPERVDGSARMNATRTLFWIAGAAALFGCVDFVFQLPAPAGFGAQFLWLDSGIYRRAQGLFYEASTLGNFCSFFVVMAVAMLAQPKHRRMLPGWALAVGLTVCTAAMLLSYSRASILACGAALLTLAILERRRLLRYPTLVRITLAIAVAAGVFALLLPEFAARYWLRLDLVRSTLLESPDRVLSGRLQTWEMLAGYIASHPWQTIAGIGYKTLANTKYLGQPVIPDNAYLSTLMECGILGLTALLALNAAILAVSWRAMRRGSFYGTWMFCFWIGEMLQMLTGDILTYWRVLPVYFWVLAQAYRDAQADGGADTRNG